MWRITKDAIRDADVVVGVVAAGFISMIILAYQSEPVHIGVWATAGGLAVTGILFITFLGWLKQKGKGNARR